MDDRARDQFDRTRSACEDIGWRYQIFAGLPQPRLANLTWLSGYRRDRFAPPVEVREAISDAFATQTPLQIGVRLVARRTGTSREQTLASIYYLLWCQELFVDLDEGLSMASKVHS